MLLELIRQHFPCRPSAVRFQSFRKKRGHCKIIEPLVDARYILCLIGCSRKSGKFLRIRPAKGYKGKTQIHSQVLPVLRPRKSKEKRFFAVLQRLRSEEHTSELQSLFNLVCRLLLEKKTE